MLDFLWNEANRIYLLATLILIGIALFEGLEILIGLSLSALLDDIFPIDTNTEIELSEAGFTKILGWLCLNKLPLMIWIVLFLVCFSISGFLINWVSFSVFGGFVSFWLSISLSLFVTFILTNSLGNIVARILPKNESSAISEQDFVGKIATITIGTARSGSPAEAKFTDNFGQLHYVMVEPLEDSEEFIQGSKVMLLKKDNACWKASFDN